jgi:hypothetical protein
MEKHPGKQCKRCGGSADFTITPIDLVTYLKDTYYLCRACFEELIKPVCPECDSDKIMKHYIHDLDSMPEVESFCLECGLVLDRPNMKSWKEKRDYHDKPSKYKDLI